jgi:hypothetical protein
MSNYAALIPLSMFGSLTQAGQPNVNGKVWFYMPGTTTPVTVFADPAAVSAVTAPVTLDTGGRFPYATYPNGIYATQPVRMLIQDANALTVSDVTFESGAGSTGIANSSFPSETTVDQVATAIGASLGGPDGKYQPFVGTTAQTVQSVLRGIQLTPQDFGAIGDGNADDTSAVQAMVTKLAALGGGRAWFPAGKTYKVTTIALPSNAAGIAFCGAGPGVSIVTGSSTADVFTAPSGSDISFSDLNINGCIGLTGIARLGLRRVTINRGTGTSTYGLSLAGCTIVAIEDAIITGGSQVVAISGASGSVYVNRCRLGAGLGVATACVDISGSASDVFVNSTFFNAGSGSVTGIKWESGATGTGFNITNSPSLRGLATPFDATALSTDPRIIQGGNLYDDITQTLTTGAPLNVLPDSIAAASTLKVTSGNGSILVKPPALTPPSALDGKKMEITFLNMSGSNFSWTFDAIYAMTTGVDGTNGNRTVVGFAWDNANTKWRERYRAQTT